MLLAVAVTVAAAPMAGASGFSSQSAAKIFKAAVSDTGAAKSFSVRGNINQPKMNLSLNLTVSNSGSSEGTLTINGGQVQIREIAGTGYFNGDSVFWTKNANAATAQLFAGKWIYAPVTNSLFSSFTSFLTPKAFVKSFFGTDTCPCSKGKTKSIGGKQAIGVMADGPGVLYVTTSSPHLIQSVQGKDSGLSAELTFGSYNAAVHPATPTGGVSLNSLEDQ